jgi:hypothetical protein
VDKIQGLEAKCNQSFALLCPAQGFPVPTYRSVGHCIISDILNLTYHITLSLIGGTWFIDLIN